MSKLLPENKKRDIQKDFKQKIFLVGDRYVGKTTFASQFPDPVILSTDGNIGFIDTPAKVLKTTKEFDDFINEIESGNHTFKTVIVDVVDHIYEIMRQEILDENNVKEENDLGGYGQGYQKVRNPIKRFFHKVARLDLNVIFIGHTKNVTKTSITGEETHEIVSTMPDVMSGYLQGLVDSTLYLEIVNKNNKKYHVLNLNNTDSNKIGGSRNNFTEDKIFAEYDKFMEMVNIALQNKNLSISDIEIADLFKSTKKEIPAPAKKPVKKAPILKNVNKEGE